MVRKPEDYRWSSYRFFHYEENPWPEYLDVSYILDYYAGSEGERRKLYRMEMMQDGVTVH